MTAVYVFEYMKEFINPRQFTSTVKYLWINVLAFQVSQCGKRGITGMHALASQGIAALFPLGKPPALPGDSQSLTVPGIGLQRLLRS